MSRNCDLPKDGSSHQRNPLVRHTDGVCPTVVQLELWRNGNDAAFETLHARFSPLLRSRIRRHRAWPLLVSHFQVDDVLQEVWQRAVPAAKGRFLDAGPGSFFAFLGKICDREVVDLARKDRAQKRSVEGSRSLGTAVEVAASPRPGRSAPETPTSHARASELRQLAREVLNARELEAWDLVEIQGYSAEEAGLAMRSSGSAVRGLLMRGRVKLVARVRQGMSDQSN